MNYMNYGYDPHQALESAFTNLRLEQPHPMYETMDRDGTKIPLLNSSQQTPLSADPQLMHPLPTPLSNKSSNYMLSPTVNKGQSTPTSIAAAGQKGGSGALTNPRSSIWGQNALDAKFSSKELGVDSTGNGDNGGSNTNNNVLSETSTSTAGTISASKNLMDFNTQASSSSFDTTFGSLANHSMEQQQQKANNNRKDAKTELESLKLKLQFKETQNESLEHEVQMLKSIFNQGLDHKQSEFKNERQNPHVPPLSLEIPDSVEDMFKKMSKSLQKKDEELIAANQTLESILTALALNPTNSMTKYGRYDPEALAHKTVVRIETLTRENQEMSKMLAYGRSKEAQIELQLMKKENEELKAKVMELQQSTINPTPSSN
ncbi:hypothetical protein ZYGR_0R00550 [Zygosaccharomyces rouxii]|uniref:ZYRO0F01298p n=2 Tax=Zygosaccharomyces rouxii TaxID=4956 RepID=C5DX10_ZYGRC|nr:uncharacterized protein ZYRO0F01298g [Zygosaccharomyces rouxii]KAH9199086.1 hypothetical protein LQ764DRAFT_123308 [Zygosaccharomyces rouxii]GAV49814.1 hypothetical protein ZYGR_0R00550 [Zygosaccharomyces rouxii]CAR28321.1 ZYRO0F01298p [Zygosaccharomyces rouxii]